MKLLRNIALCAVALMAFAVMMVPASAAVPLDPDIPAAVATERDYPTPVILNVEMAAVVAGNPSQSGAVCIPIPIKLVPASPDIQHRSAPKDVSPPSIRCG